MEFKKAVKVSDIIITVVCIFSVTVLYLSDLPTDLPRFPTIILGLTALSGILIGFSVFWLAILYRDSEDQLKKWMKKRLVADILIMFLVAILAISGVTQLVNVNMESAYRYAVIGTFISIFTLVDVLCSIILHGFSEKALTKNETER